MTATASADIPVNTTEPLVFTRTFDAPRSLVWKVWTDAKHIAAWWGPACFTNQNVDWSPRPGAKLNIDMVGPDGTVYPMPGTFVDVKEPELLSLRAGVPDGQGGLLFETMTEVRFTENAGQTTITVSAKVLSQNPGAEVHLGGMEEGWSQTIDRMGDHLAKEAGLDLASRTITSSREFNAPRDLVWTVWSDAEHMKHWWGPRGFTITTESQEFRVGGHWKMVMHGPDGKDWDNFHTYTEIRKPFRIVHQHGGPELQKMIGGDFIAIATFDSLGPKKTKVTMTAILPSADAKAFLVKTVQADKGQKENLDKLGEYLAQLTR